MRLTRGRFAKLARLGYQMIREVRLHCFWETCDPGETSESCQVFVALDSAQKSVQKMIMDDSSDVGMAFGSAGETSVLMCVATMRRSGRGPRKLLSCSSRALAGDLPDGSLWRTTSNTFAFMF